MKYTKNEGIRGAWVKGKDLIPGTKAKLVSETTPQQSQFQNKDGSMKMRDVVKIRFENSDSPLNISLNRATINALIDAFGDDSKNWINKILTVATEKVMVAGKRVTAVYLIPEGYTMEEDENGYMVIFDPKKEKETTAPDEIDEVNENIQADDIPF